MNKIPDSHSDTNARNIDRAHEDAGVLDRDVAEKKQKNRPSGEGESEGSKRKVNPVLRIIHENKNTHDEIEDA